MQALGEFIEFIDTGGDTGHAFAAVAGGFDLVDGAFDDVLQRDVILGGAPLCDLVDLRLGLVDDRVDFAVVGVAQLDDLGAGVDEAAEHCAFTDDFRIEAGIGGRGHRLNQRMQVRRSADPGNFASFGQQVGDGDGVRRFATAVEVDDGFVDALVGRSVEVHAAEHFNTVGDGIFGKHHAAQHRLFGHEVL